MMEGGPAVRMSVASLPPPPSAFLAAKKSSPPPDGVISRCDLMWSASDKAEPLGSEAAQRPAASFTPVQGCEILPFVIVRNRGATLDDDDLDGRASGLKMHYRWRRGPARAVCFFHPHRPATLQCTVTLRCFCAYHCFDRGHKQLRRFYASGGKCALPRQANEFSYGVPCRKLNPASADLDALRETDDTHHRLLRQAGLVVDSSKEVWQVVSYSRNFAPLKEDVGHQLRFECCIAPANEEDAQEAHFWHLWDLHPQPPGETFKQVTTNCVVPQSPLLPARPLLPVGLLALFAGSQPSTQPPQRIIPPHPPLARALGIGLAKPRRTSPPLDDQLACVRRLSNRYALQNSSQSIAQRRETLLTDNAFASWGRFDDKPKTNRPPATSALQHRFRALDNNPSNSTGESFTVMTWNVLADIYATHDAYPYCEPYVLAWNYRRDRLLGEILALSPDIICLQEVQADHFEEFFAPALLKRGYEGLYKHKTSRVFRGSGKHRGGKYICDGCATFFKIPKFRLVDHFGIEFARVAPPSGRTSESVNDKRLNKDNVALVLCLEQMIVSAAQGGVGPTAPGGQVAAGGLSRQPKPKGGGGRNGGPPEGLSGIASESVGPSSPTAAAVTTSTRRLIVANTHILANPEAPDVKIWQANTLTTVLTEYMEKSMTFARMEGNSRLPGLVICGDFNSTPDSAVYQLVTAGACDARHEELQSSDIYKWLHDIPLGHGLNLRSSYGAANYLRIQAEKALSASGGPGAANGLAPNKAATTGAYVLSHANYEPEFTNYTHQYVGCLDYIFFDDRYLKVTGTLDLLRELSLLEEAQTLQLVDWALPSPQRPSDHTPLLSRFEWTR